MDKPEKRHAPSGRRSKRAVATTTRDPITPPASAAQRRVPRLSLIGRKLVACPAIRYGGGAWGYAAKADPGRLDAGSPDLNEYASYARRRPRADPTQSAPPTLSLAAVMGTGCLVDERNVRRDPRRPPPAAVTALTQRVSETYVRCQAPDVATSGLRAFVFWRTYMH
jgi:hypothetical protein